MEGSTPGFLIEQPLKDSLTPADEYVTSVLSVSGIATEILAFSPDQLREGRVLSPRGDPYVLVGEWDKMRTDCLLGGIDDGVFAFAFLGWAAMTVSIVVGAIVVERRQRRRNLRAAAAP